MTYGAIVLQDISDCAAKAASVYPRLIQLLTSAGIPPDERGQVLSYILHVVELDSRPGKYIN